MSHWSFDSVFYHIYPLGLCGAPAKNDFSSEPASRINQIYPWINHIHEMGVNALYIGPLFESTSHGYDTVDYFKLDRRLGNNDDLKNLVDECHNKNIRVIFDAVFNHVGRDHFAFRDLRYNGWHSSYRDWFFTNFDQRSPYGDQFNYTGWNGYHNLVKLNLGNNDVKKHIFNAVSFWMDQFGIDGLRLDAADAMDKNFFNELRAFCKMKRNDFWLMGEVIHGNYNDWANPDRLDSVTNYECYKGLWSSHNDANYFEIAYSMNREFGSKGLYKNLPLYNFADNHDVERTASVLKDTAHLYPLYILLFTIPGVPSIYYGSEFGIEGRKTKTSDEPLRPALDINQLRRTAPNPDLLNAIKKLIAIRKECKALRSTAYHTLHINAKQYAFSRGAGNDYAVVAVNAGHEKHTIEFKVPLPEGTVLTDRLNPEDKYIVHKGMLKMELYSCWGRILTF